MLPSLDAELGALRYCPIPALRPAFTFRWSLGCPFHDCPAEGVMVSSVVVQVRTPAVVRMVMAAVPWVLRPSGRVLTRVLSLDGHWLDLVLSLRADKAQLWWHHFLQSSPTAGRTHCVSAHLISARVEAQCPLSSIESCLCGGWVRGVCPVL